MAALEGLQLALECDHEYDLIDDHPMIYECRYCKDVITVYGQAE